MSNVAIFAPGAVVPSFVKRGELSTMAKALMGSVGGGRRISVKGGVFRLIVDGKEVQAIEDRHLDVVLVAAAPKVARTFYAGVFDEGNVAPPDCWSADSETPDKSVKNPQSATCAACPKNVKGSGQGDTRACRYSQRVAVVLANDVEGDVMQLQLAATSIFGKDDKGNMPLQAYARFLGAQSVDPGMVVTRLKFDTSAATPKLFFKPMRYLTEDEYAICVEKGKSPEAVQAITFTVSQQDGVKTAPAAEQEPPPPPPKAKAKAAPAPAVEDEEPPPPPPKAKAKAAPAPAPVEEEDAPPTVRQTAAATPAVDKKSLAAVAAQWGDDD